MFLVVAVVAGLFGFEVIASTFAGIALVLFFLFLVLFVAFLFLGRRVARAT